MLSLIPYFSFKTPTEVLQPIWLFSVDVGVCPFTMKPFRNSMLLALCLTACFANSLAWNSVPMLVWSQQVKQADTEFTTVSAEDIEKFIVGTVDPDTSQETVLLNHDLVQTPELFVVFLQKELTTEQLAQFSSSYSPSADGGDLKHLKEAYLSHYTLYAPYTLLGSPKTMEEILSRVLSELSFPVYLSGSHEPGMMEQLPKIEKIGDAGVIQFLNENSELLKNKKTDFLVISLDEMDTNAGDELVGKVTSYLDQQSVKYLAMYTGNSPGQDMKPVITFEKRVLSASSSTSDTTFGSYFPPYIWQFLFAGIVLIGITVFGVLETFDMQTPAQFETPSKKKAAGAMGEPLLS